MSHTVRRRKQHQAHHHRQRGKAPLAVMEHAPEPTRASEVDMVTDHAVLRWLERVTGIDVATQVRAEILAEGRARLIRTIGNGKIRVAGSNAVLQVLNGRVVTVKTRGAA